MTEEITEVIRKLEMYQEQIKEQNKKEIIGMVSRYGEDYFEAVELLACDQELLLVNYRIETIEKIQKIIEFINFNYNPEFLKKLHKDLVYAPLTDLKELNKW